MQHVRVRPFAAGVQGRSNDTACGWTPLGHAPRRAPHRAPTASGGTAGTVHPAEIVFDETTSILIVTGSIGTL